MVYGKHQTGRFSQVGDGAIGGDGPVVVEDAHPAIIDRVTFERVQRKLAERSKPKGRTRANVYLLTGLVFCGKTGLRYCGHRSTMGNRIQYYIRRVDEPGPNAPRESYLIRKSILESFVIGKVTDILTRPGLEADLKKAVSKKLRKRRKTASNLKPLKRRLQALERKIAKGAERLLTLDVDDLADASKALSAWRTERRELAAEIDGIGNGTTASPSEELSRVMAEVHHLRDAFTSADPDKVRAALKTTIESITLFWGPGGKRKWKLERGVIRFCESLYLAPTCPSKNTPTRPRPMARSSC
jgi:site-specific DNA recombinase